MATLTFFRPISFAGGVALAGLLFSSRSFTPRVCAQNALTSTAAAVTVTPSQYELPFGKGPYLPSQATSEFIQFLKPEEIPSAQYCQHCHADIHSQWRESAHANSFRTPWYRKNVDELGATRGVAYTRHCESCHNPAALFTGALTTSSTVARPHDDDGVTCMVCHSIQKVSSTAGTGSYVMGKPAVMLDAQGQAVPGLPADAEILKHPDWHRAAVMRPLYKQSEFCAACHKAAMPAMLNDYKWLRTFTTYDEWQQSSWSRETPLSFYEKSAASSCQSCHMAAVPAKDPAAGLGTVPSHRWLGANTAVPTQYGYGEQLRQVFEFLRHDQLQVDIFALSIEHDKPKPGPAANPATLIAPLGAPLGPPGGAGPNSQSFTVLPGDWVRIDVVVRNKGIGHTLVPELRDFYESWVDFQATDNTGATVYRSGEVGTDHRVDADARSYGSRIISQQGKSLDHHEMWKLYVKAYDATVSPGKSDVIRYRFRVPPGVSAINLSAAVRYRRFNRVFTDWVFDDAPSAPDRFPTVTLASGAYQIRVGMNTSHAEPSLAPDLTTPLRWNNYGIGMLDRQQYAEAVDAFQHVIALDPKYERGYVNMAIAEYSRGRFPESLSWLDRALAMKPDDARARYYKGLNFRWQVRYDAAIEALEPVAAEYPRFRQVHQELGYIYMVQKKYAKSQAEYEQVLAVDPDDPATHRWLGAVLQALGDSAGAAREAKAAVQTANDPAAAFTAQRFWREHLDVASKAMPHHIYSQSNRADDTDVQRVLNLQNPPSYIWLEHY